MRSHNRFVFLLLLSSIFTQSSFGQDCQTDTEPPSFSMNHPLMQGIAHGDVITYQCGEQEAFFEHYILAEDNCDPEPNVSFSKEVNVGNCSLDGFMVTVQYCWKANDAQGNVNSFCFTSKVIDEEKPSFDYLPADLTIDLALGEELPPVDVLVATDDCHGNLNVSFDLELTYPADSCGYTLYRIWSAVDPCGNEVSHTQVITAVDNCNFCPSNIVQNIDVKEADCQVLNGQITIETDGAESDYSYSISPLTGQQIGFGNIFGNLTGGDYQVKISHNLIPDCEEIIDVQVPQMMCTDILEIDLIEEQEICIPNSVFDYNGTVTSATIYSPGNVNTVNGNALNSNCLTLTPATGFYGQSTDDIIVVHCFENSNTICDTTIIKVNVIECQLQVDLDISPASCLDGDGAINLQISGQNGGLSYDWIPSVSFSNSAQNLISDENYSLTVSDALGCTNTIENIVVGMDCPPAFTPDTSYVFLECGGEFLELCGNTSEIFGLPNSIEICGTPSGGSVAILNDSCVVYTPDVNFSGFDETCFAICDDQGVCDTFYFEIEVEQCPQQFPCVDIPEDTLFTQVSNCDDEVKFCVELPLGELLNYQFEINGLPYSSNFSVCGFDTLLSYGFSAIPGNGMNGPYEIQSWIIDGGNVGGGTFDDVYDLIDLMNVLDAGGNWALDTITFNISTFNTSVDYGQLTVSQQVTGDLAMLNINSATAPSGSALYLPVGTHEVVMNHTDYSFCVDTFTAFIHCAETEVIVENLSQGEAGTYCPEGMLPGMESNLEVICPDCSSTSFTIDGECIFFQGDAIGSDEILLLLCDEYGFCDSTWLIVNVEENDLPVANLDFAYTNEGQEVEIDILSNDFINGNLTSVRILIDAIHGLAVLNPDYSITFTPDRGFCGLDAFAYEICNEIGCDTSAVDVEVICTQPMVYNGFSPNEDGINDLFKINNLEFYPDHELRIFNRWGTQVYFRKEYKSDWDGRDLNNKMLPDGTYFYFLDLGNGDTMNGYVEIHR